MKTKIRVVFKTPLKLRPSSVGFQVNLCHRAQTHTLIHKHYQHKNFDRVNRTIIDTLHVYFNGRRITIRTVNNILHCLARVWPVFKDVFIAVNFSGGFYIYSRGIEFQRFIRNSRICLQNRSICKVSCKTFGNQIMILSNLHMFFHLQYILHYRYRCMSQVLCQYMLQTHCNRHVEFHISLFLR